MEEKLITSLHSVFNEKYINQHEFNYQKLNRFMQNVNLYMYAHGKTDKQAHNADQIIYQRQSIADFYKYLVARLNNLVLGHNGDGINEVKDARVDNQGVVHSSLHERLRHENLYYTKLISELTEETKQNHEEFLNAEYRFD
ncbi:hypothetical protein RPO67_11820, partial [Staphylococcus saprophyticus]|nr:hypothetical protein [Staphylococcus saprophyticus]